MILFQALILLFVMPLAMIVIGAVWLWLGKKFLRWLIGR
jgi:uncharacterized SAM-binding protein YcdF (DUF218 family)